MTAPAKIVAVVEGLRIELEGSRLSMIWEDESREPDAGAALVHAVPALMRLLHRAREHAELVRRALNADETDSAVAVLDLMLGDIRA